MALLVLFLVRPGRVRGTLGILAAAGIFPMTHVVLLLAHKSWGDPRYFAPAVLFATVGAAWLASSSPRNRWVRGGWQTVVVAVLLVGAITGPAALTDSVATQVEAEARVFGSFNGNSSRINASYQSFENWRRLAADLDPELARGKRILVDTNQGFPIVLFSRHPSGFVIPSDRDFESILADPTGSVDYTLTFPQAGPLDVVGQTFAASSVPVRDYGFARLDRVR